MEGQTKVKDGSNPNGGCGVGKRSRLDNLWLFFSCKMLQSWSFQIHIVKVQNYGLYSRNSKAFLNWGQDCTWLQYVKHFRNPLWEYFSTVKISISLYFLFRIIYCKVVQHWLPFYRSVNKYFCTIFRYRISLNKVRGH